MSVIKIPVIAIIGNSGSGKTTFMERLIPEIIGKGFKVGTIKHHGHDCFEIDKPGKDSWRHKKAGASVVVITSPSRLGMISDSSYDHEPHELLHLFNGVDLIICEGFKHKNLLKIEVFRTEISSVPLCGKDEPPLAFITDSDIKNAEAPVFSPDEARETADFLIKKFNLDNLVESRISDGKLKSSSSRRANCKK